MKAGILWPASGSRSKFHTSLSRWKSRPTFQVTPFSTIRSPTPSRSKISSVRFDQHMARLPIETTSLSSRTTHLIPRNAQSIAAASPTGPAPTMMTGWRVGGAPRSSGGVA